MYRDTATTSVYQHCVLISTVVVMRFPSNDGECDTHVLAVRVVYLSCLYPTAMVEKHLMESALRRYTAGHKIGVNGSLSP